MIVTITLPIILLIISFSAKASKDTLSFHYYQSKFTYLNNPQFWNPLVSCTNKYKNGNKAQGSAFWFSTSALVFLTDGYHLMQFIHENTLFLAFAIFGDTNGIINGYKFYWGFIGIRILYSVVFNPMYNKLLIIRK